MTRRLFGAAIAAIFALLPLAGRAQDFPARDVRFLCGFAPGGTCDLLTRLLADKLSPVLGQRVVVENRTGAGGLIAAEAVARSAPDGHTVFLVSMANMTVMPVMPGTRMPIDVDRELMPIAQVANVYNILVTGPQARFRDVPTLIALARAEPGRLSYASTGNGSSQHLAAALFERMANVSLLHVPFRGGAPAVVEMAAGRVDMMFGNMPEFLGQIRDGGLRAVAYGAPRPSPLLPLPLVSEALPGFEMSSWFGIAGPAGLPPRVVDRWMEALYRVGADPDFQRKMTENAMEITLTDPDQFRTTINRDRTRWQEVIQRAGIRAD
ncbi:Bug family tripartite tricarboxylate transporter substrate binding protein [Roseococcus sp. YIM B11640]|uniref:Bug family tripartite tricarboxylate transporter substrate binding protein n=1 Tax=Roseococcus sp. YIM B11640 TaxID=3133973 RepID=UPI003C7E996E